jgi:eukaryotic-like serine/threonine-protein kinase
MVGLRGWSAAREYKSRAADRPQVRRGVITADDLDRDRNLRMAAPIGGDEVCWAGAPMSIGPPDRPGAKESNPMTREAAKPARTITVGPARRAPAAPPDPTRLGMYRIERRIGDGGMGVVYEAFDEQRRQRVALKTLTVADADTLYRLKKEFRLVAAMTHPNLVRPYELVIEDGVAFFTMELIDGVSFLEYVRGPGAIAGEPLSPAAESRLRTCLQQLVEGVAALHRGGLLHLDLKPANVLVEQSGRVVILDFGIAERLSPGTRGPQTAFAGTPDYMSPERHLGRTASAASDWYSVGVMLFEALGGTLPRFDSAGPSAPSDLVELCAALLQRNPDARPRADEVSRRVGSSATRPAPSSWPGDSFVGRDAALAQLDAAFAAVRAGAARMVQVHGPSGVGKSALLERFLSTVHKVQGALLATGRCYEWESIPYKGLESVIDDLCGSIAALPSDVQRDVLGPHPADVAVLFPLIGRRFRLPTAVGSPDPLDQKRRAIAALRGILRRLGSLQPIVFFIDDVHWGEMPIPRV